jgi:hypothetical protein
MPIAMLLLLAAGLVAARRLRREQANLWVVVPPIFLVYVLSFHYGKDYGIRYLLPAFPFFLLLAGRGVDALLQRGRYAFHAVAILLLWQVVACTVVTPHHLAYFNELAGGPDRARRLLLDSNLDWGQDLGRLKAYMESHGLDRIQLGYFGHVDPRLYGIVYNLPPSIPTPGRYAMSANYLAGYRYGITYAGRQNASVEQDQWSWVDRFEPVARVGRSIFVFDITAQDIARLPP